MKSVALVKPEGGSEEKEQRRKDEVRNDRDRARTQDPRPCLLRVDKGAGHFCAEGDGQEICEFTYQFLHYAADKAEAMSRKHQHSLVDI